jgi:hypothetical protein
MDIIKADTDNTEQWGVVYSYGSVLAVFENEQDAQNEATGFGGAVVRLAKTLWNSISEPGALVPNEDHARLV